MYPRTHTSEKAEADPKDKFVPVGVRRRAAVKLGAASRKHALVTHTHIVAYPLL